MLLLAIFALAVVFYLKNRADTELSPEVNDNSYTATVSDTSATQTVTESTTQAVSEGGDTIEILPASVEIAISEQDFLMTLVNRKYRMPDGYPLDLAPCIPGGDIELEARAAEWYTNMYNAAKADGITLTPYSGYRRYSTQKRNYENKTQYYLDQGYSQQEALTLAARIIMPPGSSEHNLGLAMDICGTDYDFDQTKEFKWLSANAEAYGFILRYPKEKQHITKVVYEPWHWRYVGVENAKRINASGLCLEEYLGRDAG
jgi:D-alanyl-D-alanine carboxypeptidase